MKTYKTWEVIKMLSENNGLEFKRVDTDTELWVDCGWLTGRFNTNLGLIGNIKLDDEWELVPKPVDFITAINSGKKIKSEYQANYHNVKNLMEYTFFPCSEAYTLKLINGKWFIEEDE